MIHNVIRVTRRVLACLLPVSAAFVQNLMGQASIRVGARVLEDRISIARVIPAPQATSAGYWRLEGAPGAAMEVRLVLPTAVVSETPTGEHLLPIELKANTGPATNAGPTADPTLYVTVRGSVHPAARTPVGRYSATATMTLYFP
jgi:hypothetical protein